MRPADVILGRAQSQRDRLHRHGLAVEFAHAVGEGGLIGNGCTDSSQNSTGCQTCGRPGPRREARSRRRRAIDRACPAALLCAPSRQRGVSPSHAITPPCPQKGSAWARSPTCEACGDVWQDEHTTGGCPPLDAYRAFDDPTAVRSASTSSGAAIASCARSSLPTSYRRSPRDRQSRPWQRRSERDRASRG